MSKRNEERRGKKSGGVWQLPVVVSEYDGVFLRCSVLDPMYFGIFACVVCIVTVFENLEQSERERERCLVLLSRTIRVRIDIHNAE